MYNKTKKVDIKIAIKGKCLTLKTHENDTIHNLLKYLQSRYQNLSNFSNHNTLIINAYSKQQLKKQQTVDSVICNQQTNIREILIRNKQPIGMLQCVAFDLKSQIYFKQACEYILSDDDQRLKQLYISNKISKQMFEILCRIYSKIQIKSKSKIQDQRNQSKFNQKDKQIQKLKNQKKFRQKIIQDLLNKNENEKKQKQKIIQDLLNKNENEKKQKQKIIQDLLNKNENEKKQKQKIIQDLLKKNQIFQKQWQNAHQQFQLVQANALNLQSMIECSQKIQTNCILYKSKTFQHVQYRQYLKQSSKYLNKIIEDYCQNKIQEVKSQFFMEGKNNNNNFLNKIRNKSNFICLFSLKQQIFGLFSPQPMTNTQMKSSYGFLFTLITQKMFPLKQKQPIWKQSNIQLKIGNDCLTISQPKINNNLNLKYKKYLANNFEIQQDEIKQLFGEVNNTITIGSFELLTVSFKGQDKYQNAPNEIMQSIYSQGDIK